MKMRCLPVLVGATAMLLAVPTLGQPPDLLGTWDMTMEVSLPDLLGTCSYSGTATITGQIGSEIEGTASLALVSGPAFCPPSMTAMLTASWDNGAIFGTLDGGEAYGMANFEGIPGQVMPVGASRAAPGTTYAGPFTVSAGPFTSVVNGSWTAVARGVVALGIPTLGPVGLTSLILLLLVGGAWLLVRGRLV